MTPTVTAREAARLLGVDPKTLRRRLSAKYKGADRVKGAVRRGRDWKIPRAEIRRLVDLKLETSMRSIEGAEAFTIGSAAFEEVRDDAYGKVLAAAQELVNADDELANADDDRKARNPLDALQDLRKALQEYGEIVEGGSAMLHAITLRVSKHVKGREFLEEAGWL